WPVEPDAAGPVADLGAAEGQALEIAGEAVEVLARTKAADLHVQCAILQEALVQPQLRQAPGLATTEDFLGRGVATDSWVGDPVVGQAAAVALSDRDLEQRVFQAHGLLQVDFQAKHELLEIGRASCRERVKSTDREGSRK